MSNFALFAAAMIFLNGCSDDPAEAARKAAVKNAEIVANFDWENTIQAEKLHLSAVECKKTAAVCASLTTKLEVIADAIASCTNSTSLCNSVREFAGSRLPLLAVLPKGYATRMPADPFYWRLENPLLEARASRFEYRMEVTELWLTKLHPVIYLVLVFVAIAARLIRFRRKMAKNARNILAMKAEEEARIREQAAKRIHGEEFDRRREQANAVYEQKQRDDRVRAERSAQKAAADLALTLENSNVVAEKAKIEAEADAAEQETIKIETQAALSAAFHEKNPGRHSGSPEKLKAPSKPKRQFVAAPQTKSLTDVIGNDAIAEMTAKSERAAAANLEAQAALAAAFDKGPKPKM